VTGEGTARFAREWNAAFALVAVAATVLLVLGHALAGLGVATLCAVAVVLRRRAMQRQGRGFYGQDSSAGRG
jgi:hypothetical protein